MSKSSKVKGDVNMHAVSVNRDRMVMHHISKSPFVITGFPWMEENNNFNRIPERIMNDLPEPLAWVAPQPSGGMIRFKTDSKRLIIDVELLRNETSRQCTQALLSGFDVYVENDGEMEFVGNLSEENNPISFSAEISNLCQGEMKSVVIYTPLQNPIKSVSVWLDENAKVEAPNEFKIKRPILFYGSSITCGFCASRPGLTYPARISRALDANFINLGFGGGAKGEIAIAKAIAELDLSCFVMDYDFNAPNKEHLEKTHSQFFNVIRESRPDLPVLFVSAPFSHKATEYFTQRRKVIEQTYSTAVEKKDTNVYFIDGGKFFGKSEWADFTVDQLHPNDMGFARMTEKMLPIIRDVLSKSN